MNTKKATMLSFLILIAAIYYSFQSMMPAVNWKPKDSNFSTKEALKTLHEITHKPHFVGTEEHKSVKDYIVSELKSLGLEVTIQEHIAVNSKWKGAAKVKNIIAKIKGTTQNKALLLLAHYDSNPHSAIGASDDGSGVVVILEGIKSFLKTNIKPKNDIIICISDGEELGLLGASAFVNNHPWAKNIGLVLNFEARGSGGPSYFLIETNGGNQNLIKGLQEASPSFPVGNSLMYSIYKKLPNDTDLTVFREEGNINGFNFAFIGDHFDYHTQQDSYDRLDVASLNHQASYLLATLNYFSKSNLATLNSNKDDVFFNFPLFGIISFPFSWVLPIFIGVFLWFIVLLFFGFSSKKLDLKEVLYGFNPFIKSILASGLLGFFGWKIILLIHPKFINILQGFPYNGYYYIGVFLIFSIVFFIHFYSKKTKKLVYQNLLIAPLFFWVIINGLASIYLKGAGFFLLPLIVLLIELTVLLTSKNNSNTILFFTLLTLPVVVIFAPLLKMFPVGLGLKMIAVSNVLLVLILGVLLPLLLQYQNLNRFKKLFFAVGIFVLVVAEFNAGFNESQKLPNSIFYVLNADTNKAYWASFNSKVDKFTQQFLGKKRKKDTVDSIPLASKYHSKIKWINTAKKVNLPKPTIKILKDTIIDNFRNVSLVLQSNRASNKFEIVSQDAIKLRKFMVNGIVFKNNENSIYPISMPSGTLLTYFLTESNEQVKIDLVCDKNESFNMDIYDVKYDLLSNKNFSITPREKNMMPMPFVLNDATVIKSKLIF